MAQLDEYKQGFNSTLVQLKGNLNPGAFTSTEVSILP